MYLSKILFFLFNLIVIVDTITNVPSIPPHPPSTKPLLRRPTAMSHAFVQIRPLACLFQSPHPPHSFLFDDSGTMNFTWWI